MVRELHSCTKAWGWIHSALLHTSLQSQRQANRHRVPVPSYLLGQRVWLSSKDLALQVESQKLTPHFVGPFVIDQIVNPYLVHHNLPPSLKIHPTLHVSQIKLGSESDLVPLSEHLHPPMLLMVAWHSWSNMVQHGLQLLVNCEGYGSEQNLGFLGATSWITVSCVTLTGTIPISLAVCQEVPIEGKVQYRHGLSVLCQLFAEFFPAWFFFYETRWIPCSLWYRLLVTVTPAAFFPN